MDLKHMFDKTLKKIYRAGAVAVMALCFMTAAPLDARAQICENPAQVTTAESSVDTMQNAAISAATATLQALITADVTAYELIVLGTTLGTPPGTAPMCSVNPATVTLFGTLGELDCAIRSFFERWWDDWREQLQNMAAEMNTIGVDQTRNMSSTVDAQVQARTQRHIQEREIEATRRYRPDEDSCVVDTVNRKLARANYVSRNVRKAFEYDFEDIITNNQNRPESSGRGAEQQVRFDRYVNFFCDPDEFGGNTALCGPAPGPATKNADIEVSSTIFGAETIDIRQPEIRMANEEIIKNLTGFKAGRPLADNSFDTPGVQNMWLKRRVTDARLSVPVSTIATIIGERAPMGDPADPFVASPEIQAIRLASGVDISETSTVPSKREIRQAMVEKVWQPKFYVGLDDDPHVAIREWAQLRAYNLAMMNDVINRTEQIATLLSVQLARMIDSSPPTSGFSGDSAR